MEYRDQLQIEMDAFASRHQTYAKTNDAKYRYFMKLVRYYWRSKGKSVAMDRSNKSCFVPKRRKQK
ncbi:hypothetical protein [Pseudomonas luteola]|uniref:hypothetical protein n=1 Tax=Pseudomonas luteola TaxID=47886 RepID=UPI00123B2B7A|nr:hypothetical protein [Pseudomonas luteola]QEU28880.1 hypothetical protein FOB45_14280 [Pseudomonas luteola]